MRLFIVCVLLLATAAAAPNKNKNKNKNKNANNNNNNDDVADMRQDETSTSDHRMVPELPNTRAVMEDRQVRHGPQYRMKSGDYDCMVQCKGSVSGRADMDSSDSYYRYIHVNVTECLDRWTLFPAEWMHEEWDKWNATVNKLMFRKPSGGSDVHRIPKRLSKPTEVHSSHFKCVKEDSCFNQERSFGFVVYIPPTDMDVTWTVDWEVTARNPYGSIMSDSEVTGGVCEMYDSWRENARSWRMEQNSWNLHRENRELSFWREVGDNSRDQSQWDDRWDNRMGGDNYNRYQ